MHFRGPIPELPNVSVDNFQESNGNYSSTCFFLTHSHSDHTQGLKEIVPFLKNKGYYLYCSPITRLILLNYNYGFEPDDIRAVEDTVLIEVPGNETNTNSYLLSVTVIPAGHSPGSVMFLFQNLKKIVLFTGDFRILKEDLQKFLQLKSYFNGLKTIDKIYFDATFFSERYKEFPERSTCNRIAIKIIKKKLAENPNIHVNISTGALGGYEDLFITLAKEFKCKIHVDEEYFKIFSQIPCIGNFITTDANVTFFHSCQCAFNSSNFIIPKPSFQLRMSAMWCQWKSSKQPKLAKKVGQRYYVCYPTHSSYSEVCYFLESLNHKAREPFCSTIGGELEENASLYFIAARAWQKIFRGHVTRRHIDLLQEKATHIQKNWRAFLGRMAFEELLSERFAELCRIRYKTLAATIQRHWKGYWVRSRIFSYYKLKSWLEFVQVQNVHLKSCAKVLSAFQAVLKSRFSERYRAFENRIESEQREEEAKEWILYILFKLHHLLRTHQISGIYSLPKTRSLSDVEKMLKGLKYKDFMIFYNSCKADARQKKANEIPQFILQNCKYAAHFEREWYQRKSLSKDSYVESTVPRDRLTRYELHENGTVKESNDVKLTLCVCQCSHCTTKKTE